MSLGKVIRHNLVDDYVDTTAQAIYLESIGSEFLTFASSAEVPDYMFLSLATLLECSSSELAGRVIADLGEAKIPTSPCVYIQTSLEETNCIDYPGSRYGQVFVSVKNVVTDKNVEKALNIINRVCQLLDTTVRTEGEQVNYADLTIPSSVKEFDRYPFRCWFQKQGLTTASEIGHEYRILFSRLYR